jgi:uncharacterized protein YcgI (DUF1989 family)
MSDTVTTSVQVPAREGRAVRVPAGHAVRVTDVEGMQVADTWAFCVDDPIEHLSAQHTRAYTSRLFPQVGESFVTNRRREILLLERDDSPGIHDMLMAACDAARYAGLGVEGWHASCEENLQKALAEHGIERVMAPQPVNLFMNIPVNPDATLSWEQAPSRAGDAVTLRAQMDCIVAVSSCPQDIVVINAGDPTPILLEVLAPAGS